MSQFSAIMAPISNLKIPFFVYTLNQNNYLDQKNVNYVFGVSD